MSTILTPDTGLLFMKVGIHDGEEFSHILERKRQEIHDAGFALWGYGGTTCHPSRVQPFAKVRLEEGDGVYLIMEEISSNHQETGFTATEMSRDGIRWEPIPDGINCTGSKYAVVIEELEPGDLDFNLSNFSVDIGPNRGKSAEEYIKGRVDKACLVGKQGRDLSELASEVTLNKKIKHIAKMADPFAVFVK